MFRYSRFAIGLAALLSLLMLTSCTMWGEKKVATWKSVTSGEQLTRLFWQSVKEKNWKDVQAHMTSTVVGLNERGSFNREEILEHLKQLDITDFQVGELRTEPAGVDLIVTYTLALRGTVGTKPLPEAVRMMSVWQHLQSGWVLVAHSAVPKA